MDYLRLVETCNLNMGQSPDSDSYNQEGDGIPFFQGNADFGEMYPIVRVWCTNPTKIVDKGTLLISVRAPIGALNFSIEESCIGRGLAGITAKSGYDLKYIYYALKYKKEELNDKGTGSTFKAISKSSLEEIRIRNASIESQRKCVKELDLVRKIIEDRKEQIKQLDTLIKARFVEMFGDLKTNTKGLQILNWNDVFITTTGKLDSNAMVLGGKYPFFTCAKQSFWIDQYAFDCEALLLAGNNAAGIYDIKHYKGKFNAYQRTYVLQLKNEDWSYVLIKRQLEDKLEYLRGQSKGTNTRYLTMGILSGLQFLIPDIKEQRKYDSFVQQVDKSKIAVQKSLDEMQILFDSLMQKYFD